MTAPTPNEQSRGGATTGAIGYLSKRILLRIDNPRQNTTVSPAIKAAMQPHAP